MRDDAGQIGAFSPVPVDGKSALREVYEAFFQESENATFTPIHPHFRSSGSTGVSWGHFVLSLQLKGGPMQIPAGCFTITFTQVGRQWLVCASHFSWLLQEM